MRYILISSAAAVALFSGAALAQTTGSGGNIMPMRPGQTTARQGTMPQQGQQNTLLTIAKLKQDLQDAGFTDIQILSDSFTVQAKDKDGNPAIMTITPNSIVAFEAMQQSRQARSTPGLNHGQPQTK